MDRNRTGVAREVGVSADVLAFGGFSPRRAWLPGPRAAPAVAAGLVALMSRLLRQQRHRVPEVEGDDAALVAGARRGDRSAFEALHRRHVDFVWSRLTRLLGPDPEREDLTQQIFMELYRGLERFRGDATFRTYLSRVVVHVACDHLERRRRRPQPISADLIEVLTAPDASPEARAEQRQKLALTWSLLDRIRPKKRIAFILRTVDGLSLDEVGEIVGASVQTVAKRIKHAQDELHRMMIRRLRGGGT